MPIVIETNLEPMERMLSAANLGRAQELLTRRVMEDDYEEVPVRTGTLRDSAVMVSEDSYSYEAEYAGYVYHGTSRQKANPWFERTKAAHAGEWEQEAADLILGGD